MAVPAFPTTPPPFITAVTIIQLPRLRGTVTTITITVVTTTDGSISGPQPSVDSSERSSVDADPRNQISTR